MRAKPAPFFISHVSLVRLIIRTVTATVVTAVSAILVMLARHHEKFVVWVDVKVETLRHRLVMCTNDIGVKWAGHVGPRKPFSKLRTACDACGVTIE